MRNLKKFLALVLAMMMAFSLLISANAAKDVTAQDIYPDAGQITEQFKEAVDVLYGMGIMTGDRGSFKPDAAIMRSEMAAVMYRLMTGDTTQLRSPIYAAKATERFKDVKATDWFAPYIGWCYDAGLMKGYNGYVRPWANVTGYETEIMVLRAMGYGKNGEYTGQYWSVNADSQATKIGLLKDVDKTSYHSTLAEPSRRDVVASIVFQAAQLPQVHYEMGSYNPYVGVAVGTGGNVFNPSLGEQYFGLTCHYGIVVGNQASGESNKGSDGNYYNTKIGFSVNPTTSDNITGQHNNWATNKVLTKAEITDEVDSAAYYYATDKATAENVTLAFDWKTDLSLFNHKVKVWYDKRGLATETVALSGNNGSVGFGTNCKTYALYDKANPESTGVKTAEVFNVDTDKDNKDLSEVFGAGVGTFFNYSFARMDKSNQLVATTADPNYDAVSKLSTAASPINRNNGLADDGQTKQEDYPLYLGIDNTGNGAADVIISLNLTISKVTQDNDTQAPFTTGILTSNKYSPISQGVGYFDLMDQVDPSASGLSYANGKAEDAYSNILNDNMMDSDAVALDNYVAAVTVTGTDKLYTTGGANTIFTGTSDADGDGSLNGNTTDGAATPAATTTGGGQKGDGLSSHYYKVMKLTRSETKEVWKYDPKTQEAFFSDGTSFKRSVFAPAVDGRFQSAANVKAPVNHGTYTFWLDEDGNYLFWTTDSAPSAFVYGTYIDWETKTASGTFRYPMVYVDAAGHKKLTQDITKYDSTNMDINGYASITLPKRDATQGNNSGTVPGAYIGYAMNGGTLTSVTASNDQGTGFWQAAQTNFGTAGKTTIINKDNVGIGAVPVANATGDTLDTNSIINTDHLFLTNSTKFVVVSGAGTDDQEAIEYTGLTEFLGAYDSVKIDASTAPVAKPGKYLDATRNTVVTTSPYQMVYYSLAPETYDQVYDPSAKIIGTVFIPEQLISRTSGKSGDLYFVGDKAHTLVDADNDATLFTMYKDGVEGNYWITGMVGKVGSDADTIDQLNHDVFYKLHDTGKTAYDSGKIYELVPMTQKEADGQLIGKFYLTDGTNANKTTAGQTTVDPLSINKTYLALTQNAQSAFIGGRDGDDMFNVGGAKVKNLYKDFTISTLRELNGQSSLASNQGVKVSCVLGDSAKVVSQIYVNYVQ